MLIHPSPRPRTLLAGILLLPLLATSAPAATYYIGAFTGSTPANDSSCGTGTGAAPNPHPCSTLAYWTQSRRQVLQPGDTVRIAPGTYGPTNSAYHCIVADPGVLYEGRNANDTQASSSATAIIDLASTPESDPCWSQFIGCNGCDFHNFQLRSLTLRNARGGPGTPGWMKPVGCSGPGGNCENFTMRHVRISGSRDDSFGFLIGDWGDCGNGMGRTCTRRTRNVVIDNCEFDNSLGDGLMLGLIDGFTISNTTIHNNGNNWCNPSVNPSCPTQNFACNPDCNDDDGLNVLGAANGTITDSGGYQNRQETWDFTRMADGGDNCEGVTHSIVMDRTYSHNCGNSNYSFSGCANTITVRNSFVWGEGNAFNMYYGSCRLKFYNNTVYSAGWQAVSAFSAHGESEFRNNVFVSNNSGGAVVRLTNSQVAPGNNGAWENNIVANTGDNGQASAIMVLNPPNPNTCNEMQNDADYPCAKVTCTYSPPTYQFPDTGTGLTNWRNARYFGTTTAANDKWGNGPTFVNSSSPSVANLHLQSSDTIAQNAGIGIASFSADYDAAARPQGGAWDIGADEVGGGSTGAPAPPTLLSVEPVP
jgi:hypothetical protein